MLSATIICIKLMSHYFHNKISQKCVNMHFFIELKLVALPELKLELICWHLLTLCMKIVVNIQSCYGGQICGLITGKHFRH